MNELLLLMADNDISINMASAITSDGKELMVTLSKRRSAHRFTVRVEDLNFECCNFVNVLDVNLKAFLRFIKEAKEPV